MIRFFLILLLVVPAMGCSSLPSQQNQDNWHEVELGEGINGKWFADHEEFILQFQFSINMKRVVVLRALDIPGNGFDVYTQDGIHLQTREHGWYQIRLARHFELDSQLFFRLQWGQNHSDWPKQRLFVFMGNQLYYSDD